MSYVLKYGLMIIILFFMGVIVVVGIFNYPYFNDNLDTEKNITEEKQALIEYSFDEWYGDLADENKVVFAGSVINFGEVEATGLRLGCIIYDSDNNIMQIMKKPINNIASKSWRYDTIKMKKPKEKGHTSICFIDKCDNCLILNKQLPDNYEYFEALNSSLMT